MTTLTWAMIAAIVWFVIFAVLLGAMLWIAAQPDEFDLDELKRHRRQGGLWLDADSPTWEWWR